MSERGRIPPDSVYDDEIEYDDRAVRRGRSAAERGRERVADAFDTMADRIEYRGRRMRRRGGARAQAGRAAESAGRALESGADYLRAHDIEEMKLELEARVREKPLPALVAAAVAGFVFARIVR
ncbi:MAG: hypothetical protein ACYC28_11600 [Longimicrobiales bacterium]